MQDLKDIKNAEDMQIAKDVENSEDMEIANAQFYVYASSNPIAVTKENRTCPDFVNIKLAVDRTKVEQKEHMIIAFW